MPELRQRAACIGLSGTFSVLRDMFGFQRGVVPPDPVIGRVNVSLRTLLDALGGRHFHLNVIATGSDNFTDSDNIEVDYAIFKLRNIYCHVDLTVGRVQHWSITVAEADSLDAPTEEGQLRILTKRWEVPNNGIDLFIVHDINISDTTGMLLGKSPTPGPCEDKDRIFFVIDTSVSGLWGSEQTARTVAHELAHYLGLGHENDEPDNLMCQSGKANSIRNSTALTSDQGEEMREHCMTFGGCDFLEVQPERYSLEQLPSMIFQKRGPLAPVLALATLRHKDYPESEKLADLRRAVENTGLEQRVRRAALLELGRLGGPGVTRTLKDLASTATEPSLARARSESLRLAGSVEPTEARRPPTLIARIAADPTRAALPKLEAKPLIVRRPRTIAVAVSAAPRSMLQQAQQALAASGLEPAPALQVHLSCLRHEYLLALSTHADAGPEPLVERAAALGALLSKGVEPQTWSSDLFLFSEPSRTGIAGEVDIRGVGHDGLVMLAGTGRVAGGEMTFILRSMDVPGHMAMIIQGAFRRGSLELTRVQSDAARPRGRTPRSR